MDFQNLRKNICRICLNDSVVLDWNAVLYGYCDITYKDCFYKYTRLERVALDPYSPMLCQICLNSLYNVHTFISKALESHKYFEDTNTSYLKLHDSTSFIEDIKYIPTEFETVMVEKIEVEPILQEHFVYEHSDKEVITRPVEDNIEKYSKRRRRDSKSTLKLKHFKTKTEKILRSEEKGKECVTGTNTEIINSVFNLSESINEKSAKSPIENARCKTIHDNNHEQFPLGNKITTEERKQEEQIRELENEPLGGHGEESEPKVKKKYKEIKKPRMCSICSKILHNKQAVQMHEKTHMENRERKETCKICGLKFYDKRNLYSHKRIHKENREKIHKCEFCNKAFYNKGGLNIHRRIHLGQMIPCSLCSKQFFRQIDLDRHMNSHSATAINSEMKKRSRYFVRCKHCDKSILSTSFKSHTAAHLNEPLMKCSICSKEFFRRGSCVLHLKKVHQKNNEEYNDFIIVYKKNRISHLFLEQKADIQFTD